MQVGCPDPLPTSPTPHPPVMQGEGKEARLWVLPAGFVPSHVLWTQEFVPPQQGVTCPEVDEAGVEPGRMARRWCGRLIRLECFEDAKVVCRVWPFLSKQVPSEPPDRDGRHSTRAAAPGSCILVSHQSMAWRITPPFLASPQTQMALIMRPDDTPEPPALLGLLQLLPVIVRELGVVPVVVVVAVPRLRVFIPCKHQTNLEYLVSRRLLEGVRGRQTVPFPLNPPLLMHFLPAWREVAASPSPPISLLIPFSQASQTRPARIIGVPCESMRARCRFRIWRARSANTPGSLVSPSTPQFQLKLSLVPSPMWKEAQRRGCMGEGMTQHVAGLPTELR